MRILVTALAGLATLAGCSPSSRISTGLQRYGIDERRATCAGDRLSNDLSLGQLQQLGRAAAAYNKGDSDPTRLTPSDLFRVAGQIKDPAVAIAVGKAVAGCGVPR